MSRPLRKDGTPRKKPGPKPRAAHRSAAGLSIQAAAHDPLRSCLAAYDAAPDQHTAAEAFRRAMPPMHTVQIGEWANIVAQAMARRVLTGKEASVMLYAAQIAHTK